MLTTLLEAFIRPEDFWTLFRVETWEMVLKGLLIGILVSAPMGPVGLLIIRRTMNKGRCYGISTGIGAAISDMIYALITGLGVSFVMDFINDQRYVFWLKLAGAAMLLAFGIHMFLSNPIKGFRQSPNAGRGTVWHNGITGFLITFSNPLIIFLFIACFSLLTFVVPKHWLEMAMGYASILCGATLWWLALTYIIKRMRNKITIRGMLYFNRILGSVVISISFVYAIITLFHLNWLY